MKLFLSLLFIINIFFIFAQWTFKIKDNGIDEPFKYVTTVHTNGVYLRLFSPVIKDFEKSIDSTEIINGTVDTIVKMFYSPENPDGIPDTTFNNHQELKIHSHYDTLINVSLDLFGANFCGAVYNIDINLIVNGESRRYSHSEIEMSNKSIEIYLIKFKLYKGHYTPLDLSFYNDFKAASEIRIRVSSEYCEDQYFEFNQKGSAAAIKYLLK